jgi:mycoredoxin
MTKWLRRWWPPGAMLLGAIAVLVVSNGVAGILIAVLLLVYAWMISPAFFPRSTDLHAALVVATAGEAPLILWKPGCAYCIRLRAVLLLTSRRAFWVDSSLDGNAEVLVRSQNAGDHTTPTVVFRDQTRTNPGVTWVRSLLRCATCEPAPACPGCGARFTPFPLRFWQPAHLARRGLLSITDRAGALAQPVRSAAWNQTRCPAGRTAGVVVLLVDPPPARSA